MKKIIAIAALFLMLFSGIKIVNAAGSQTVYSNSNLKVNKGFVTSAATTTPALYRNGIIEYKIKKLNNDGTKKTVFGLGLGVGSSILTQRTKIVSISQNGSGKVDMGYIGNGFWQLNVSAKIIGGDICSGWTGEIKVISNG